MGGICWESRTKRHSQISADYPTTIGLLSKSRFKEAGSQSALCAGIERVKTQMETGQ